MQPNMDDTAEAGVGAALAAWVWRRAQGGLAAGWRAALNALLPPQCLGCGALVDAQGQLCAECWGRISFLEGPACAICGYPFEYDIGEGAVCGACARHRPRYDRARAVMRYDCASRGLLIGFKHGDRTEAAGSYGRWMARAGAELLRDADLIVPVPLHRWRLLRRRYNQSAMLAQVLGRASGKPVVPDLLVRRRSTPSQGGLSRRQRIRNVRGAFAIQEACAGLLQGQRVLLIDDVLTTGATVEACAVMLRRNGAAAVDVLTLARVVRPVADTI